MAELELNILPSSKISNHISRKFVETAKYPQIFQDNHPGSRKMQINKCSHVSQEKVRLLELEVLK